ncbi:hypothetical protein JCM8547_005023 [Rhodosporidiobolus lusitaniae]
MRFIVSLFPFLALAAFVGAAPAVEPSSSSAPTTTTTRNVRIPFKDQHTTTTTTRTTTTTTTATRAARTPSKDRFLTDFTTTSSSSPVSTAAPPTFTSTYTSTLTFKQDIETGKLVTAVRPHVACMDPSGELGRLVKGGEGYAFLSSEFYSAHSGGLAHFCGRTLTVSPLWFSPSSSTNKPVQLVIAGGYTTGDKTALARRGASDLVLVSEKFTGQPAMGGNVEFWFEDIEATADSAKGCERSHGREGFDRGAVRASREALRD